jgi:hypothetical protein
MLDFYVCIFLVRPGTGFKLPYGPGPNLRTWGFHKCIFYI